MYGEGIYLSIYLSIYRRTNDLKLQEGRMNPTTEHVVYAAIALFVLAICAAGAYKLRSYFVARALEQGAAALARQHNTYTNTQYV